MSQFLSNFQEYEEYKDEYVMNRLENALIESISRNDLAKVKEMLSNPNPQEEINIFIAKDSKSYTSKFVKIINI